jgi:hypothetical protein
VRDGRLSLRFVNCPPFLIFSSSIEGPSDSAMAEKVCGFDLAFLICCGTQNTSE